MKRLLKSILARTPYRIVRRSSVNRFQAVEDTVQSLGRRGFAPTRIVDGGANIGHFATAMRQAFPAAVIHLVEPQPGCRTALETLVAEGSGRILLHPVALCSTELDGLDITLAADADTSSTGAHVVLSPDTHHGPAVVVRGRALDKILEPHVKAGDRIFLKLDLQGYELQALRGAARTLAATEVILIEVSFYAQAYEPPISELSRFLADHNFELYDIASLHARARDNRPKQADFVFARRDGALTADRGWS